MKTAEPTTDWLQTELDYSGQGVAQFKMPEGALKGPATVKFDERGHAFVEMKIEEIDSETVADSFRFLYGDSGTIGNFNECVGLEVTSNSGVFSANENIRLGRSNLQIGGRLSNNETISFELIHSRFQANDGGPTVPAFWVIPLINFVGQLTGRYESLEDHPLRLNTFPNGEKEEWSGNDFATAENSLISAFRDGERTGYIERVPNYLELVERLKSGATSAEITAVMVGDADVSWNNKSKFAVTDGWLPADLLLLLSLAFGNGVGSPWIEFRDTNGKLIQRRHLSTTTPSFASGLPIIDEVLMPTAMGHLLSKAFETDGFGAPPLRVIILHLNEARNGKLSIDAIMGKLARAFESLFKIYEIDVQDLVQMLPADTAARLRVLLEQCESEIRQESVNDPMITSIIDSIASRVSSAMQKPEKFGLAVSQLAKRFGLPDEDVINEYLKTDPKWGNRSWHKALSTIRGQVVHEGSLTFDAAFPTKDVVDLILHLRDVLTRIVLKILGYEGPYIFRMCPHPLDWVSLETTVNQLGFRFEKDAV